MNDAAVPDNPVPALRLRQLLLLLVVVLAFEGLARKAFPFYLSVPIFLLKDVIVTIMAIYVVSMPQSPAVSFLWTSYRILVVLFIPPLVATGWHDPLLALFGAKEYLLYPVVGLATFHAFQNARMDEIRKFFQWAGLLVIPTTMLALVQLRLPHDSWLNKSVGGASLEGFAAADELRVSSTFSFVAQFCAFLNAEVFIVLIAVQGWRNRNALGRILFLSLFPFLVLASFVTGSRGAVVGNTATVLVAGMFILMKFQVRNAGYVVFVIGGLGLGTLVVNHFFPQTIAAYSARQDGQIFGINSMNRERIFSSFHLSKDKALSTYFGNGLGIMSNGSDSFSNYAAIYRANYGWTETDFPSTLFEGGYYLAFIWYGFRFYVIMVTTRRVLRDGRRDYFVLNAFTQAYVIIIGTVGTLGIQPPIAIWWWLGVGTSLLFCWKSSLPPEAEAPVETLPPPKRLQRGRSLYADVLHPGSKTD